MGHFPYERAASTGVNAPIAWNCTGAELPAYLRWLSGETREWSQWWGVVLDAPDGRALAHSYARLLGRRIFNEDERGAAVAPSEDAGYNLAFG